MRRTFWILFILFAIGSLSGCKKTSLNSDLLGYGGGSGSGGGGGGGSGGSNFPGACLNLEPGQICTLLGPTDVGHGKSPTLEPKSFLTRVSIPTVDDLGNLFFYDTENSLVWYWNRTSSTVSRLGQSVAPDTAVIVAGNGHPVSTMSDGSPARSSGISLVTDMVYDPANGSLYLSFPIDHIVRAIDSSGNFQRILGGGVLHTDGALGVDHQCSAPYRISLNSSGRELYVACTNSHRIKKLVLAGGSAGLAFNVIGTGAGTTTSDGSTVNSLSTVKSPLSVTWTPEGLFISEAGAGTDQNLMRFFNTSGSTAILGSVSVGPSTIKTLNSATSGCHAGPSAQTAFENTQVGGIFPISNAVVYLDSDCAGSGLYHLNRSGADTSISGITISNGQIARLNSNISGNIFGVPLSSTRFEGGPSMLRTATYDPVRNEFLVVSTSTGIVSESRIVRVTLGTTASSSALFLPSPGKVVASGSNSQSAKSYKTMRMSGLHYDNSSDRLYFTEVEYPRVRYIDSSGNVQSLLGNGSGGINPFFNVTFETYVPGFFIYLSLLRGQGLATFQGNLIVSNQTEYTVGFANLSETTSQTFLGISVLPGMASDVAGTSSSGNVTSGTAFNQTVFRSPSGIAINPSGDLFVADAQNHCIKRIDSTGTISALYGNCGTSGNSGATGTVASLSLNLPENVILLPNGSLIVADTYNHKLRYLNQSGSSTTVLGQFVANGEFLTIACQSGSTGSISENDLSTAQRCTTPTGLAYIPERNWLCYSNAGTYSNIRCIDLVSGQAKTVAGQLLSQTTPQGTSIVDTSQEGVLGTSARLRWPRMITWDGEYLYIADTGNSAIRMLRLPDSL